MAESSNSNDSPIFGCIFLLVVVIAGGIGLYRYFFPSKTQPITTSLSAFFVDDGGNPIATKEDSGHLKIKGQAYQSGKALPGGMVELTVNTLDESFRQSVSAEVKSGQFETEDDAFRSLSPADHLRVAAEVTGTDGTTDALEIYVNTAAPTFSRAWTIGIWAAVIALTLLILFGFFVNFTGRRTPDKNRNAIIFSYLVGGVFLAVPLLAPVLLLQVFPNVQRSMVGMPAGLVLTRVGTDSEAKNQWALNIGGFSKIPRPGASPTPAAETPSPTPTPTRQGSPSATPRPTTTPSPTATAAVAGASPPTQTPSPISSPTRSPAESPRPTPTPARPIRQEAKAEDWDGIVEVEGGLLIPLYVIILSVIGGAINMTRKVPRFQGEGEYTEVSTPRIGSLGIKSTVKSVISKARNALSSRRKLESVVVQTAAQTESDQSAETPAAPPAPAPVTKPPEPAQPPTTAETSQQPETQESLSDQAKKIDGQINSLVKEQLKRGNDTRTAVGNIDRLLQEMQKLFDQRSEEQRLLGFDSFDEWLSNRVAVKEVLGRNWRVELLNQYMYLISAPFLAIVAYYILDLLGLNKQAVLVVISFSVGLISERILNWILGIAGNYLRNNKSQAT